MDNPTVLNSENRWRKCSERISALRPTGGPTRRSLIAIRGPNGNECVKWHAIKCFLKKTVSIKSSTCSLCTELQGTQYGKLRLIHYTRHVFTTFSPLTVLLSHVQVTQRYATIIHAAWYSAARNQCQDHENRKWQNIQNPLEVESMPHGTMKPGTRAKITKTENGKIFKNL